LSDARPNHHARHLVAGLAVAAVLPFLPVLAGGFVWDDHPQIAENAHFGLGDLPGYWLQSENAYAGVGRPGKYNPLGWSLFLLESVASGGARPSWLYHATSLLAHGIGVGLFGWLLLAVGRGAGWTHPRMIAIVCTLWVAWAPIQSEVVCWPSARFDSIAFAILAGSGLLLVRANSPLARFAGGLLAAAALLSKEAALPGVLLLAPGLAWLQGLEPLRQWRSWAPGALGAVAGTAVVMVVRRCVAVSLPSDLGGLPLDRLVASESSLLRLAVLQDELSLMRPIPLAIQPFDLAVALALVAVVSIGVFRARQPSGRMMAFGAVWLIALALPGAVAAVRYELLPDRYLYLASPGMALVVGGVVMEVRLAVRPAAARWLAPALFCVGLVFVVRDVGQTVRFEDDVALFQWERARFPDVPQTAWYLGMVLADEGRYGEAEEQLQRATELGPELPQTWRELAALQARWGDLEAAMATVDAGLVALPDHPALLDLRREIVAAGER